LRFFLFNVSFAQQKETVYILFGKASKGNYVGDEGGLVLFICRRLLMPVILCLIVISIKNKNFI